MNKKMRKFDRRDFEFKTRFFSLKENDYSFAIDVKHRPSNMEYGGIVDIGEDAMNKILEFIKEKEDEIKATPRYLRWENNNRFETYGRDRIIDRERGIGFTIDCNDEDDEEILEDKEFVKDICKILNAGNLVINK